MAPFHKILIANRGEIAVRVIRAARALGIRTVAVFSEADRDSMHVRLADEACCIGPYPPQESYLSIPAIMAAVELSGADAIHPGYGFLSENVSFAEICRSYGVCFIGPSPQAILLMGHKSKARKEMKRAGVPVTPGSEKTYLDATEAFAFVKEENIEFPVLIKAAAGGGGRGMRLVQTPAEFPAAFNMARREAEMSFDNGELYVEKYIVSPKHIEVQILGDSHGNVIHLGERECSVQRRHQKLIEETPCAVLKDEVRQKIQDCAVRAAKAIGYESSGTFEFLLEGEDRFYFMEMNTRLQVEHGVTEMVSSVDIVAEQIRIAAGEPLSLKQDQVTHRGHSIECRINAEDPESGFIPSPGRIDRLVLPGGPFVRVDTALYPGYEVSPHYDSLVAKLMAWGPDRPRALARMLVALDEFTVEGIKSTLSIHKKILRDPVFISGRFGTDFLTRLAEQLPGK